MQQKNKQLDANWKHYYLRMSNYLQLSVLKSIIPSLLRLILRYSTLGGLQTSSFS